MTLNNKKVIIDAAYGSITNKYADDKVILVGEFPDEKSNYANSLQLVINRENNLPLTINVPYNGYNMQLFVEDFTGDRLDNIMIRGEYNNTLVDKNGHNNLISYELGVIYKYENEKLIEIFNMEKYKNNNLPSAKFKNNYRTSVSCNKKKYLIDLSTRSKEYLNEIYDENKKVKTNLRPTLDNPSEIFPIKEVFNDCYNLLIYQRIVGINNSDVIGTIETLINLNNNKINIVYEGLLSYPYEEVHKLKNELKNQFKEKRKILEGSRFIKTYSSKNKNNNSRNDDLNLIIKSMDEEANTLYVDAYLLNLKSYEIKSLSNLKIILKDDQDRIVGNKVFNRVDIGEGLKPKDRMRILLSFFSNEYNVFDDLDINNLTCEINYDARS
ncbi:hypothetical protein [Terrisporobacter mayombei]|uniref:Uncharacterized protein n=1 Tax=Terrisporobacter mayombei TaxID=1541 RepID=A0ABY9Q051_9FIRM|nr:hypothetical protein [Terrisporobacter mayombei]MCC3866733.1 hypothetical protein [Terrisporobacter mayombei]WMT80971.1 hypothetical protein TEMA_13010 [Terrisporobacter mayombei]